MDDLNWENRSIDWKIGWKYGQGDESVEKLESDDFKSDHLIIPDPNLKGAINRKRGG